MYSLYWCGVHNWGYSMMTIYDVPIMVSMNIVFVGEVGSPGDLYLGGIYWDTLVVDDWEMLWSMVSMGGCKVNSTTFTVEKTMSRVSVVGRVGEDWS